MGTLEKIGAAPTYPTKIWCIIPSEVDYFTLQYTLPRVCKFFQALIRRKSPLSFSLIDRALFRDAPQKTERRGCDGSRIRVKNGQQEVVLHPILSTIIGKSTHDPPEPTQHLPIPPTPRVRVTPYIFDADHNPRPLMWDMIYPSYSHYFKGRRLERLRYADENVVAPATTHLKVIIKSAFGYKGADAAANPCWPCGMCKDPTTVPMPPFEINAPGGVTLTIFMERLVNELRFWYGWGHWLFTVRATSQWEEITKPDQLLHSFQSDRFERNVTTMLLTLRACMLTQSYDWRLKTHVMRCSLVPEGSRAADEFTAQNWFGGWTPSEEETQEHTKMLSSYRAVPSFRIAHASRGH